MIEQKYKLPNGNTFILLGNQPIYGCKNVLIKAGGDVVFLKEERIDKVSDIKDDIVNMSKPAFFTKYSWPENSSGNDLYWELKDMYSAVE
jgi:hypothetical protein